MSLFDDILDFENYIPYVLNYYGVKKKYHRNCFKKCTSYI